MTQPDGNFYVTFGTLASSSACYVVRRADKDLARALEQGEFCYVLSSRQIGKSSLVVRTTEHLKCQGIEAGVIDLSALGVNCSVEHWYHGLGEHLGRRLGIRKQISDYWEIHADRSPLQRWMGVLNDVVLKEFAGQVVIFIDEVDTVRSLGFSTDEFFAAIRSCWNARPLDPAMRRLTFCIVGTATPADLIEDPKLTPFNIGKRIPVQDFTSEEAAHLCVGLGPDRDAATRWMTRIHYWADGHPCLTQRLCHAAAEQMQAGTTVDIDASVRHMFLQPDACKVEGNLAAVRARMLGESPTQASELITIYKQVLKGPRACRDDRSELSERLKLTGAVKERDGHLVVRNRIYAQVFDWKWADTNLPGAEKMRQRSAYRLGMIRATAVSSLVVSIVLALAITAAVQARRANWYASTARAEATKNLDLLYASDMSVIETAFQQKDYARMRGLLAETANNPERGFEWFYWNRETHRDKLTLLGHRGQVNGVLFSPGLGGNIVTYGADGSVRFWDLLSGTQVKILQNPWPVHSIGISVDGERMVSSGDLNERVQAWEIGAQTVFRISGKVIGWQVPGVADHTVTPHPVIPLSVQDGKLVVIRNKFAYYCDNNSQASIGPDQSNRRVEMDRGGSLELYSRTPSRHIATLSGHKAFVCNVLFSPNGRFIASCSRDRTVIIWDALTGHKLHTLIGHTDSVRRMDFSPDSARLATVGDDKVAIMWDVATGTKLRVFRGHEAPIGGVSFSADGQSLATCSEDGTAKIWDLRQRDTVFPTFGSPINADVYESNGTKIVVCSDAGNTHIMDAASGNLIRTLTPTGSVIKDVSVSGDGGKIVTADAAGALRVYVGSNQNVGRTLGRSAGRLDSVAISYDGKMVVTGDHKGIADIYDVESGTLKHHLSAHNGSINSVAISPGGNIFATCSSDTTTKLWDAGSGKLLHSLDDHTDRAYSVTFSPDGKFVVTGSRDQTAIIWSVSTGRRILRIVGHNAPIYSVGFSPDSKRVVTGGGSLIKLWDTHYGRLMLTLSPDKGRVNSVSFSSDGHKIVAATTAGTIQMWSTEPIAVPRQ